MFDYVDGKADWMAYGLPVEGEEGPFAGSAVVDATRCDPDERAGDALARLAGSGESGGRAVVVDKSGIVFGVASRDALDGAEPEALVADVMDLSVSTVRPSVPLPDVTEERLVTSSDGRFLGVVRPPEDDDRPDEHRRLEAAYLDVAMAVKERFGETEPDETELRVFLRERLIEGGRTPDQADEFLSDLGDEG